MADNAYQLTQTGPETQTALDAVATPQTQLAALETRVEALGTAG